MQFQYVAYGSTVGIVKGQIDCSTMAEARAEVARHGYKPLKVAPARRLPGMEKILPSLFHVSTAELVHFCRYSATMLGSGGNLLHTLEMLQAESRNRVMRNVLGAIRKALDEGGSLSSALAEHPKVFSPLFVSVVEVGEYTGRLAPALEHIADMLEADHEAKQKAFRTMMYPVAIMGLSLATMAVLMTVALPPLLKVFSQMGAHTPIMTKIAVNLVAGIKANFIKIFAGAVIAAVVFSLLRRFPKTKYMLDSIQSQLPMMGSFVVAGELSRFSRTMAILLESGVSLSTALKLATSGCKNLVMKRAFNDAEESLLSGHGLTEALKKHKILPPMFVELVMIGEESNSLRRTMNDAADSYQKQLERRLNNLLGMLEPVSTVVVGLIVGFIAFSMFVPIYSGLNAIK